MNTEQQKKVSAKPHRLNRFQEEVNSEQPVVASKKYLDKNGRPAFAKEILHGFHESKCERITLQVGTRIMRYGTEHGQYASIAGTPFAELALPYKIRTCIYNEYEVVQDGIMVIKIEVDQGIVAKQPRWPCERGGGEQYYFPDDRKDINYYVGRGLRRLEVSEWTIVQEEDVKHK